MQENTKICSYCKTENPRVAKYCRHCGVKLDGYPEISDFRITAKWRVGDSATLSWDITNADKVTLNGADVTKMDQLPISITGDSVFKLVANKGGNSVEKILSVHPENPTLPKSERGTKVRKTKKEKKRMVYGIMAIFLSLAAIVMLIMLSYNGGVIQSFLGISYSAWKTAKVTFTIISWILISISSFYILVKLIKKYY